MSNKDKIVDKIKEGVSVEEIEKIARKYTTEVFVVISLIIATISSIFGFFLRPGWSIFFAGLCAIIGITLPDATSKFLKKITNITFKKDKTTEIIIGIVRIVFALFLPLVIFAEMGLLAGKAFHHLAKNTIPPAKKDSTKEEPSKEEHI